MLELIKQRLHQIAEHGSFLARKKRFDRHTRDKLLASKTGKFLIRNCDSNAIERLASFFVDDA